MSTSTSPTILPTPRPERPAGVVVAAVMLALLAFMVLIGGGAVLLAAGLVPIPAGANSTAVKAVLAAFGAGMVLFSGYCAWTVVDLFRMKRWAQISITILGVLLALFSVLMSLLYAVLAFSTTYHLSKQSGVSHAEMKGISLAFSAFWVGLALVGVWWLVYFSLARTRLAFEGKHATTEIALAAREGALLDSAKPGMSVLGLLVNCLGILYVAGALVEAVMLLMRFPPMFFGHIFSGHAGTVIWIAVGAIKIGMGIGLIRRLKVAWVVAIAFSVLAGISQLVLITPYGKQQMLRYQLQVHSQMASAGSHPTPAAMLSFMMIAGVVVIAAELWLLVAARRVFDAKE